MGVELWRKAVNELCENKDASAKAREEEKLRWEVACWAAAKTFEEFIASDEGKLAMELLRRAKELNDDGGEVEERIVLHSASAAGKDGAFRYDDVLVSGGVRRFSSGCGYDFAVEIEARPILAIIKDFGSPRDFIPWLIGELDKIAKKIVKKTKQ